MHKRHAPAFKSAPMNSHWNDQTKKNNYNVVLTANKLKYNPTYQTRAYGRKQTALYGFVLFLLFYSSSPSCKTGRGVSIGVQTPRCHINYYTREWLEPSLSLEYHERKRGLQNANWTLQMYWQSMVDMFQRVPAGVNRTHASFLNALAALKKEKGGKRERERKESWRGLGAWMLAWSWMPQPTKRNYTIYCPPPSPLHMHRAHTQNWRRQSHSNKVGWKQCAIIVRYERGEINREIYWK